MSDTVEPVILQTLDNFLGLVQKGERCTILVHSSGLTGRLLEYSLRSIVRVGGKAHVCTFASLPELPSTITPASVSSYDSAKTPGAALSLFRKHLRKISSTSFVVFDALTAAVPWDNPSQFIKFVEAAARLSSRKGIRTLWLLRSDLCNDKEWAAIADSTDCLLIVRNVGLQLFGQIVKAKGYYSSDLFLPRRIRLADTSLEFDQPGIPMTVLSGDSAATDGTSAMAVQDALDLSYRKVFDSSPDGIIIFDLKGEYREPNERAAEIFGMTKAELRLARIQDLVAKGQTRKVLRSLLTLKRKGKIVEEVDLVRKSGRPVHVLASSSLVDRGRYMVILHDLSGKVREVGQIKTSAEYYQGLFAKSFYPQAIIAARKLVLCNDAFRDAFAIPFERDVEQKPLIEILGKGVATLLRDLFGTESKTYIGRSGLKREVTLERSGQPPRRFEVAAVPLPNEDVRTYHLVFVDVTTHAELVEQYGNSEKRYRELIESSVGAISVVRGGKFVFINQGFLQLFGYGSPGELIGEEISTTVARRERASFLAKCEPAHAPGGATTFQYAGIRKDGSPLQLQLTAETILYDGSHSLLCYHRDITEQKGLDDQVRKKAHTYSILDHMAGALASATGTAALVQAGLEVARDRLGYDGGGVYTLDENTNTFRLVSSFNLSEKVAETLKEQSVAEGITGYVAKTREALVLTPADHPPFLPFKSLFESERLEVVTYLPLASGEKIFGILMLMAKKPTASLVQELEILGSIGKHFGAALERAYQYDKLLAAETRYRTTLEGMADVAYQALPNGTLLVVSPRIENLLGFMPAEFLRNADLWRSIVHPDDRTTYSLRVASQSEPRDSFVLEYRMLPKGKAAYKRIRDSVRYTRDASGIVISIQGTISDISSQVDTPATVSDKIVDSIDEAVVLYDNDLICRAWNRPLEQLTGRRRSEVIGKKIHEGGALVVSETLDSSLRRVLSGETVLDEYLVTPANSNEQHTISVKFSPVTDTSGKVAGVIGIAKDVSSLRQAEVEVSESESRLREVINSMGDALLISDLGGRVVEVNREFTRLTGYSRSEVLGKEFPYPWLIDEEMPRFVQWISELREKRFLLDFDMTWRDKAGHDTAISLNTTLFRNAAGEPVAMLNIARDISERRRLANELATRNRQIEMLNRIISKANRTVDFVEIFDTIAKEVRELVTYDEMNVGLLSDGGKSVQLLVCIDSSGSRQKTGENVPIEETVSHLSIGRGKGLVISNLPRHHGLGPQTRSVQEGFKSQVSIPIILNDRVLGTLNVASKTEKAFTPEHLSLLQPVADQIGSMIDRSRLFQQVSDDSKYIHNLLNSIDSIVLTVDHNYRIREVNEAWREFADLQGLEQYRDEASVMGVVVQDVITVPRLWDELQRVMPQFFDKSLSFFATEVVLGARDAQKTYQLVINPMTINETVTGLVFTYTDITSIIRTEEEIKRRNEELMVLNAISSSISHSLNLDEVLDVAISQIRERLNADVVLSYLTEKNEPLLRLARTAGVGEDLVNRIEKIEVAPRSSSLGGAGLEPLFISEGSLGDERMTDSVRRMFDILGRRPLLGVPLQSKDRLLGALIVGFADAHVAQEPERRFLLLLGNQLGAAVENAQLYSELQSQVQRVTTLYELGKGLTGVLNTKSLLELVQKEISGSISLEEFHYEIYFERGSLLRSIFRARHLASGETIISSEAEEFPMRDGTPQWKVVTTDSPLLVQGGPEKAMMVIPVRKQQEIVGLITVIGAPASVYTQSSLRLLESIANLTEIALDRVVLYEDTMAKSHEIEARNRELDDFAYVVSHDLKEPLITIEGYSKIVLSELKDRVPEEGQQFLASIVQSSARMKNLIEDLLTLSRVGRVREMPDYISVRSIVEDVLREIDFTLRQRKAVVHVAEELPTVPYDPTQLGMVFRNLISNAVKFNLRPTPEVRIGVKEEPAEFIFSVQDNGIGIAKEHFARIFVIFQRLNRPEDFQGTGAGLTIVKKIIERHGGRIWLDSVEGVGTTFYFTIPR